MINGDTTPIPQHQPSIVPEEHRKTALTPGLVPENGFHNLSAQISTETDDQAAE